MGELVYINFNYDTDDIVKKDEDLINIESVKAVEAICAPFDCKVIENNISIMDDINFINEIPECENNSWLIKFIEV